MSSVDVEQDEITLKKLIFIYNALEDGWAVSKAADPNTYVFKKPHADDKSITFDDYLSKFIHHNFTKSPFLNNG